MTIQRWNLTWFAFFRQLIDGGLDDSTVSIIGGQKECEISPDVAAVYGKLVINFVS